MKFAMKCANNVKRTTYWDTMPDSGAQVSMAPYSLITALGINFEQDCEESEVQISGVGGVTAATDETRALKLWIQNPKTGHWAAELVYVSRSFTTALLSYSCLLKLQLVTEDTLSSNEMEVNNNRIKNPGPAANPVAGLCRSTQRMNIETFQIVCGCPK
jgi:hypothetical protein